MLSMPILNGRIGKWILALSKFELRFESAKAVKGQIIADFITKHRDLLTVKSCIKVRLDLQADKSPVVVKGPFFPRVVNPRYRIRGIMCNARIQSSKAR
jgi:hypothetical protein